MTQIAVLVVGTRLGAHERHGAVPLVPRTRCLAAHSLSPGFLGADIGAPGPGAMVVALC